MKFISLLMMILCACISTTQGQFKKHVIYFKDKANSAYTLSNPQEYLSQRAIDRRTRYGITVDSTDLPVSVQYVQQIAAMPGVTVLGASKWFNAIAVQVTDENLIDDILSLPFVVSTKAVALRSQSTSEKFPVIDVEIATSPRTSQITADEIEYGESSGMIQIHNGNFLHNLGFSGNGMQVAVLDAGFYWYDTNPAFDSMRLQNRLIETWDFVQRHTSVREDHVHGLQCLSTMASNIPGIFVGSAPHASYYLYRTEEGSTEFPIELFYLALGYERADSAGADVTSTSLGYSTFDHSSFHHTYADMDGNTTMAAIAADMAAAKGMLMVTSAGNEGGGTWRYITTPADADSVLTVGAVNVQGTPAAFSSYGPTSDGRIKPEVAAVGWGAMIANHITGQPYPSNGTSFAAPYMAGIATCLWQAFPEYNNMTIIEALIANATQSHQPDDRVGYGIPDVKKAFVYLMRKGMEQHALWNGCETQFDFKVKMGSQMKMKFERNLGEGEYQLLNEHEVNGEFAFQNIRWTDNLQNVPSGIVSYKVSIEVLDTIFVVNSFQIQHSSPCKVNATHVFVAPNPFGNQLQIEMWVNEDAGYTVELYNSIGQRIIRKKGNATSGVNYLTIPTPLLAKGVYYIKIFNNNKVIHQQTLLH